ncbi:hypothetical protein [Tenacibaculum maritimum]|uniref:hypothetical protein n=4 Tax=Tenacibaculum maritimum TaxID=107401 RepID=UPI0012E4F46D|nr:hypothetical protein [Tenacibaculum maritimum]MDB0599651.1 hypothetical protein [Tenacibaculum maritimum]MDB0599780.1 hypothetical protein [Tenacibaculum maritimum]MDB0599996.1 hypothetical protein [Tenacibaculum maritimum]MDB0610891.1 hypothetical protein [Tenacibaculum maritimum]MDB0613605.1 hypothetical protein [Tenacibaculum maritimum]
MATDRNTVIGWFQKYMKPTAAQFETLFKSIWFKNEQIPVTKIEGIQTLLDEKLDKELFIKHIANGKGLKDAQNFPLFPNQSFKYTLPQGAQLFAIKISFARQETHVELSTSENFEEGYCGELIGSLNDVLNFPFLNASSIWIRANYQIMVTPIIYQGIIPQNQT